MFEAIKYGIYTALDTYLVEVAYVEMFSVEKKEAIEQASKAAGVSAPTAIAGEVKESYYVQMLAGGGIEYTKNPTKATCFGFLTGALLVLTMRRRSKDCPNLQFSLISAKSAVFIDQVTGGGEQKN